MNDYTIEYKSVRGQGIGSQLVEKVELLGRSRGCKFCTVSTMDWEAEAFYEKSSELSTSNMNNMRRMAPWTNAVLLRSFLFDPVKMGW